MRLMRCITAAAVATVVVLAATVSTATANHGDIHARCVNGQPVVTERPPGTENVQVVCRNGLPEFRVTPTPVPTFDPVAQGRPPAMPEHFGGWVTVWLNGKPLKTPYDPLRGIQEPGAYLNNQSNRVMMPVRFFTAAFGGDVAWDPAQRQATLVLKGKTVKLFPNAGAAIVGDKVVVLEQPSVLFLDRIFVPVRFLMETFGATVEWDQFNKSVRIQMDGAACVSTIYCGEAR